MSKSIVIVEDDSQIRTLLKRVLAKEGFNIIEAEDGTRALPRIRKLRGRVAAVLTDIDMGRMNGLELAESLRAEFPTIAIIFLSALPVPPAELERVAPGSAFIHKPFESGDLVKAVGEATSSATKHSLSGDRLRSRSR
jgi:CheY-like chemotaxis protein